MKLSLTAITFAGLFLVACGRPNGSNDSSTLTNNTPSSTTTNAIKPQWAKLIGRWERPDGGYVLQIMGIDSSGKISANYFNPGPINVSRAVVLPSAGTGDVRVFVELRDVNYPGCTYTLTYDEKNDQLFGQYFQAAIGETYDITFGRLKDESQ